MDDQHAVAALYHGEDQYPIEWNEASKVDDTRLDSILRQYFRDAHRDVHVRTVRHQREIVAAPPERRAADRNRYRSVLSKRLLDSRIAVERNVLVEEHGIG